MRVVHPFAARMVLLFCHVHFLIFCVRDRATFLSFDLSKLYEARLYFKTYSPFIYNVHENALCFIQQNYPKICITKLLSVTNAASNYSHHPLFAGLTALYGSGYCRFIHSFDLFVQEIFILKQYFKGYFSYMYYSLQVESLSLIISEWNPLVYLVYTLRSFLIENLLIIESCGRLFSFFF